MIICTRAMRLGLEQKLVIVPLGDIHHNARGFDREKWVHVLKWLEKTAARPDRQVLTLLMGDYLDTFSRSERKAMHFGSAQHETTREWTETKILDDAQALLADLEPVAHTIGGVVAGNHTYRFTEASSGSLVGKTVDQYLAEKLDVPFFGMCGALVLTLCSGRGGSKYPFKIFMHHGFGQASTKSASIKQVLDLRAKFPMFNLYVMGHNHVKICTTQEGIDVRHHAPTDTWRMCDVVQGFVRSASFLKGYIEGDAVDGYSGSYIEERCLAPSGLGVVSANLRWKFDERRHVTGYVLHVQE
jgi:hypothetical protein